MNSFLDLAMVDEYAAIQVPIALLTALI